MKKLFNVTIGGYYLCSIVLGIAMALTIGLTACDMWDYGWDQYAEAQESVQDKYPDGGFVRWDPVDLSTHAINYDFDIFYPIGDKDTETAYVELKKRQNRLDELWYYVPLSDLWSSTRVYERRYDYSLQYGEYCLAVVGIVTVLLSVLIMEGKSANKVWRQKMLQAFGIAMGIVLIDVAWRCAWYTAFGGISTLTLLLPIAFLVMPALILKKTRSPKKAKVTAEVSDPNLGREIIIPHSNIDNPNEQYTTASNH